MSQTGDLSSSPNGDRPTTGLACEEMREMQAVGDAKDEVSSAGRNETDNMIYRVHDVPPLAMWPVYGLQQTLMCVSGALSVPFLISSFICADNLPHVRAELLSITFFMCGVATLLQTSLGVRLPIIQGASFAFLPPISSMMQLDIWKCPPQNQALNPGDDEPWEVRIREIQGNLILASLTQLFLGCTGLVGFLLRFIGPVAIAPTIALIGMGFTNAVTSFADKQWGVAALTAAFVLVFSLWIGGNQIPVPSYSKQRGFHFSKFPVFVVISVLLAIGCGWLFCYVLTVADVLPNNSTEPAYRARTDINLHVVRTAPWFKFPYPLMFGTPTISLAGFFGMFMATMSSVLESMGDYYACARVSGAPPPPAHAVNRGIAIEGFSSVISGMVGAGHATTSYSGNIAAIAVTRVASRRVFQIAGGMLVLLGVLTKFGAVVTLIPDPVIGGLNAVLIGTLISVGLSTLHFVDMESPRNVTVIGLTFMLGLAIPQWINAEPGRINTGDDKADQVLNVLLGTPMFVGGLLGVILDNIAPGTQEERGIVRWRQMRQVLEEDSGSVSQKALEDVERQEQQTYDLPYISDWVRTIRCCAFVPFCSAFNGFCFRKSKKVDQSAKKGRTTNGGYENRAMDCYDETP